MSARTSRISIGDDVFSHETSIQTWDVSENGQRVGTVEFRAGHFVAMSTTGKELGSASSLPDARAVLTSTISRLSISRFHLPAMGSTAMAIGALIACTTAIAIMVGIYD